MSGFNFDNPEGKITIGGILLNDVWVTVPNCLDFLPQPDERGENREVPDRNGAIGYGFLTKETEVPMQLAIRGSYLHDGTATNSRVESVQWGVCVTNWLYLQANLPGPYNVDGAAAIKTASFAAAGGNTLEGPVQVRGVKRGVSGRDTDGTVIMLAACRVRILDGMLALA